MKHACFMGRGGVAEYSECAACGIFRPTERAPTRGAVLVSTGAWGRDKRADDPDILKTGNLLKLTENDNFALAAA